MVVSTDSESGMTATLPEGQATSIIDPGAKRFLWICIVPVVLFLIIVSVIPFVVALIDSMRQMNLSAIFDRGEFVGLANYLEALGGDTKVYHAVIITLLFMVLVVPIEFVLGLLMALLLNREFMARRFWVTIFLLPTMMAPVAVGMIWQFLFMPSYGLLSYYLKSIGVFAKTPIFSGELTAFLGIMVVDIWEWTPFMMLLLLAGLFAMPREPIEAAEIDGASRWQIFWRIQLPFLRPMIILALLFRAIDASKIFDIIYVLTRGGPGFATEVISVHTYRTSFISFDLGTGAAISLLFAFFSILVAAAFYKIVSRQSASGGTP